MIELTEMSTAIHEAGHAVMGYITRKKSGKELISVSIIPDDETLGRFISHRPESFDPYMCDPDDVEDKLLSDILISLAGGVAEKIAYGEFPTEGVQSDLEHAVDAAMALAGEPDDFKNLFTKSMEQAERILRTYWSAVERLADKLIQSPNIEGDKISKIIEHALQK